MNQNTTKHQLNFVIFALPFQFNIGGVVALYNLARIIDECGFSCKIFDEKRLNLPNSIFEKYATESDVNDSTVVVYPEIVFGNPLKAKYVVRWLLCELGIHCPADIYTTWEKDDFIYHYSTYNTQKNVKDYNIICPLYTSPALKNYGKSRDGYCHIIRKGHKFHKPLTYIHPSDSLFLDDNLSQEILIEIFNRKEYLISYDPYSYVCVMAALCGCIPIIVPMTGTTKEQWLKSLSTSVILEQYGEYELKGIAYGIEEIEYARNTLEGVKYQQEISIQYGEESVHRFINNMISIVCTDSEILAKNDQVLKVNDVFPVSESAISLETIKSSNIAFPTINPITDEDPRPFWSVMIPTYNNTQFLETTLKSVLEQALEPEEMQIEVVDDCSTEVDVEAIVKKLGKGRISYYRQPQNLGFIGNWNACLQRARGYWVHILHQDDFVMPGFYQKLQVSIKNQLDIGAAFCRFFYINEAGIQIPSAYIERETSGILENWLEAIGVSNRIECPSIVVKRSVYEKLGGFCIEAGYASDWEMWKRIAVHYKFWYEPEILAAYRRHSQATTSRYMISGENIAYTRRAIEISELYLPENISENISNQAREYYALRSLSLAKSMIDANHLDWAINQIREGLKCSISSQVMANLGELIRQSESLIRLCAELLLSFQVIENLNNEIDNNELSLNLRDINLIAFPNWEQSEDLLYEDLASLITNLINHPQKHKITLLIEHSGISDENANFIFSDVVFNLVQEQDVDIDDDIEITLISNLTVNQWQKLLSQINSIIRLDRENKQAIIQSNANNLQNCHIEEFSKIK